MGDEKITVDNSSNIASYAYSPTRSVLTIEFKNGKFWEYERVPYLVFHQMKNAESKGQFFSQRVKPYYSGREVES